MLPKPEDVDILVGICALSSILIASIVLVDIGLSLPLALILSPIAVILIVGFLVAGIFGILYTGTVIRVTCEHAGQKYSEWR